MHAPESDQQPVQAWVRLKPKDSSQQAVSPAETEASTQAIVKRVAQNVGHQAQAVKLLPNLGSFIVSASPAFMRELAHQPEVESAKPTDQPLSLIRPVKSKEVTIGLPRRRTLRRRKRRGK